MIKHTETRLEHNLPMADYQRSPGLSASQLSRLVESPLRFHVEQLTGSAPPTTAMQLGTCSHALFFENRREYTIRPETHGPEQKKWSGNSNECKAWLAAHAGETVLTQPEANRLEAAVQAVRDHKHVVALGLRGPGWAFEVSAYARCSDAATLLRGRFDAVWLDDQSKQARVVDLKTTSDASTRALSRTILQRRYHIQAAMYRRLLALNGYELVQYTIIAADLEPPALVNVRHLSAQAISFGDEQLSKDIELFKKCRAHDYWPDYADADPDKPGYIDLPEYVYGDSEILTGMTPAN